MVNKKLLRKVEGKNYDRKPPYNRLKGYRGILGSMTAEQIRDIGNMPVGPEQEVGMDHHSKPGRLTAATDHQIGPGAYTAWVGRARGF